MVKLSWQLPVAAVAVSTEPASVQLPELSEMLTVSPLAAVAATVMELPFLTVSEEPVHGSAASEPDLDVTVIESFDLGVPAARVTFRVSDAAA